MNLKDIIKKWLFSKEINRIGLLEEKYNESAQWMNVADRMYSLSANAKADCEKAHQELEECRKLLNQICDVGVDVGFRGEEHSWAVVCIAGKPEYVKFIPLNYGDARRVLDFLKQFRYSRHVIDSPLAFRDMLKQEIL